MRRFLLALLLAGGCGPANLAEICDDSVDNDNDTLADCEDPQCTEALACVPEVCNNGQDDNGNALIDCADAQCVDDLNCIEQVCNDALDNDADGNADCTDEDCEGAAPCIEAGNCGDNRDNDLDALEDCEDPECVFDPICTGGEICNNDIDDNNNNLIDCQEASCANAANCLPETNCNNNLDDDQDGFADCNDSDCDNATNCNIELNCNNGLDDDQDGFADCNDSDCDSAANCSSELNCNNNLDDDADGATDCADVDCDNNIACQPETNCNNNLDDDQDGFADCNDGDCNNAANCNPELNCNNGLDDDQDGSVDCADNNCAASPSCVGVPEVCQGGIDEDLDGAVDCNDEDCFFDFLCLFFNEQDCSNGVDDDSDGLTDCADPNCDNAANCGGTPQINVTCPAEIFALPGQNVSLAATATLGGGTLNTQQSRWSIQTRPVGSATVATITGNFTANVIPDLNGEYVALYTGVLTNGSTDTCTTPIHVNTNSSNLIVEISWNTPSADVDIHLLHPTATTWYGSILDCNYLNCNNGQSPAWGAAGTADDPRLTIDDVQGFGPEQIVIDSPEVNTALGYRLGAYNFTNDGDANPNITARIFCGGALVSQRTHNGLVGTNVNNVPNQLWKIADITFTSATTCNVTTLDQIVQMGGSGVPR